MNLPHQHQICTYQHGNLTILSLMLVCWKLTGLTHTLKSSIFLFFFSYKCRKILDTRQNFLRSNTMFPEGWSIFSLTALLLSCFLSIKELMNCLFSLFFKTNTLIFHFNFNILSSVAQVNFSRFFKYILLDSKSKSLIKNFFFYICTIIG